MHRRVAHKQWMQQLRHRHEAEADLSRALESYLSQQEDLPALVDQNRHEVKSAVESHEEQLLEATASGFSSFVEFENPELASLRADLSHFAESAEGRLKDRLAFYQGVLETARASPQ